MLRWVEVEEMVDVEEMGGEVGVGVWEREVGGEVVGEGVEVKRIGSFWCRSLCRGF